MSDTLQVCLCKAEAHLEVTADVKAVCIFDAFLTKTRLLVSDQSAVSQMRPTKRPTKRRAGCVRHDQETF